MKNLFLLVVKIWLPISVAITLICLIIAGVIQQNIRLSGNDPQIQIAEDAAAVLDSGGAVNLSEKVDVAKSLSPFIIIYDLSGNVVNATAVLNDKTPTVPKGVLTSSKGTNIPGENRVTWQPQKGVRLATVVKKYNNGYVVVGRNMREIEIRVKEVYFRIFAGWIVTLVLTLVTVMVLEYLTKKKLR